MDETDSTDLSFDTSDACDNDRDSPLPPLPSPFGVHTSQPRLAIDCEACNLAVIERVFELTILSGILHDPAWTTATLDQVTLSFYEASPQRLVLVGPSNEVMCRIRDWEKVASGLNVQAAANAIQSWLQQKATYPARPWFEGGESRACQIYTGPILAAPSHDETVNMLVIEPKWLEVPK